jgi:hypothetical protein
METNYSQKLWVNTIPQTLQKKREDGYGIKEGNKMLKRLI